MLGLDTKPLKDRDADRLRAWLSAPEAELFRDQLRYLIADAEIKGFVAMVEAVQMPAKESDAADHARTCDEMYRLLSLFGKMADGKFSFRQMTPTFSYDNPYDDTSGTGAS